MGSDRGQVLLVDLGGVLVDAQSNTTRSTLRCWNSATVPGFAAVAFPLGPERRSHRGQSRSPAVSGPADPPVGQSKDDDSTAKQISMYCSIL